MWWMLMIELIFLMMVSGTTTLVACLFMLIFFSKIIDYFHWFYYRLLLDYSFFFLFYFDNISKNFCGYKYLNVILQSIICYIELLFYLCNIFLQLYIFTIKRVLSKQVNMCTYVYVHICTLTECITKKWHFHHTPFKYKWYPFQ